MFATELLSAGANLHRSRIKFLDQPELEQLLALPYPDDAFGRIEPLCT